MSTARCSDDDLWGPFREEIERRLNRDRPSRYSQADQSWMEPTIAFARARMPGDEATVLRRVARTEVVAVEKRANRKANVQVKRWALGRAPLFWLDLGPLPFTLDQSRALRVRFDAAAPEDYERHALQIRDSAKQRHEAEVQTAAGLEWLAWQAREYGYERVAQLGDLEPRDMRHPGAPPDLHWDDEDEDDD